MDTLPTLPRRTYRNLLVASLLVVAASHAQTTSTNSNSNSGGSAAEIDACGVLVQSGGCVLFQANGGKYVLSDYADFKAGDAVRVVGTADPSCVTICAGADGCIRGAKVYDPSQFPCGQALPNFPGDICSGVAGGLTGVLGAGFVATRRRGARKP